MVYFKDRPFEKSESLVQFWIVEVIGDAVDEHNCCQRELCTILVCPTPIAHRSIFETSGRNNITFGW